MMLHVVAYGRSLACRCCSNRFARPLLLVFFADETNQMPKNKKVVPIQNRGTAGSTISRGRLDGHRSIKK